MDENVRDRLQTQEVVATNRVLFFDIREKGSVAVAADPSFMPGEQLDGE